MNFYNKSCKIPLGVLNFNFKLLFLKVSGEANDTESLFSFESFTVDEARCEDDVLIWWIKNNISLQ